MDIFKMIFGRKKIVVDIQTQEDAYEISQAMAKNALRNAALAGVQQSLKVGAITNTQAASLTAHMRVTSSLRTINDAHLSVLDANGELERSDLIREIDTKLFKECVSPATQETI